MLGEFEAIVDRAPASARDGLEHDLRDVAKSLLSRQFVYADDHAGSRIYDLARRYRAYFGNLFDALGYDLRIEEAEQFVGIVGQDGSTGRKLSVVEATFLLALRVIHEDRVRTFSLKRGGRASALLSEVWSMIEERTGRDRPSAPRCRAIMESFRRHGLVSDVAELADGDMEIEIRPAITLAVTSASVDWLERYSRGTAKAPGTEVMGESLQEPAPDAPGEEPAASVEVDIDEDVPEGTEA